MELKDKYQILQDIFQKDSAESFSECYSTCLQPGEARRGSNDYRCRVADGNRGPRAERRR